MRVRYLLMLVCVLVIAACAPVQGAEMNPAALPTLFPTPLPDDYNLNGAEDVARRFLEAWVQQDYATMHSLTAFASRDKTPAEDFIALYEDVAADMTLLDMSYNIMTLQREQPTVALLSYDITFETLIVGEFTDDLRQMRIVIDSVDREWRVAWTAADIFNELADGGALRLERSIPRRANIYDRTGEVLADQNGRMVTVNLIPGDIPNREACIGSLAEALTEDTTAVTETIDEAGTNWLTEVGVLEPAAYLEFEARLQRECDAEFGSFSTRRYPNGTLMPHIVGYVGYPAPEQVEAVRTAGFNQDSIIGQSGIESTWDETLRGTPGGRLSIVNGNDVVRIVADNPPQPAHSVWLTIDSGLQAHTQDVIADVYRANADGWAPASKGAAAVVISPKTGEVLAMVSFPTYDANAFIPFPTIGREAADVVVERVQNNPRTPQLNRVTQGTYTSGSVMKIASTLAIVDAGIYEQDERYSCIGTWNREQGFVRVDWLPQGHGLVSVRTALAQSCNPFYYEVGYQMDAVDPNLMPQYFNSFGLGTFSGITDLPENPGLIAGPDFVRDNYGLSWSFSRSVNMSIGQDIDITPLQIARMTAIVANPNMMYKPQLVMQAGLIGEEPAYTLQPELLHQLDLSDEA
ncbi:MAG: penicillin-binding transpeptidase domain-containing protein, partial [Chloroflexota bacterium]